MRADVILLTVEPNSGEGTYSFVCPSCEDLVEKPADRKIVSLLKSVGVDVAQRPVPTEELEPRPDGPPFTVDDVIDFHFLLGRDESLEALMASVE
jgi:hypothetical protein